MVVTLPGGVTWRLHDMWRARLLDAEDHYKQNRNDQTRAEYRCLLKIFKDLVFYGIVPKG